MKFNNFKTFLGKSILAPLLVIIVLLYNEYLLDSFGSIKDVLFGGIIFLYGVMLIINHIIIKSRKHYLLAYGLIFIISGVLILMFDRYIQEYKTYTIYIIGICFAIYGLSKIIFRTVRSNFVRFVDAISGVVWLLLLSGYTYSYFSEKDLYISFIIKCIFFISCFDIIFSFVRKLIYYKENKQLIKEMIINNKATPKGVKDNQNSKNVNYKKKKIKEGKVEVIDLERFFRD